MRTVLGQLGYGLLLLGLLAVLFPGLFFGGEVLFERDLHQMLYGQYAALERAIRAGSWPVWDPWPGFGQPMLANPVAEVLYPPTWLCLWLEPGHAYSVFVVLHLLVGGLAVRALAKRLGGSGPAAAGAGVLWMLSGPVLSLANLWHHLAGASLMPVVVLAMDDLLRATDARRVILLGGAAGLQALAGSFEMCALTAALAVVFCVTWFFSASAREGCRGLPWRVIAALAAAAALAAGLSAGLLLPVIELMRDSARAELPPELRGFWSLSPLLLPQVALRLLPQQLPLTPEARTALFEGREPLLASVYLGLSALPLTVAAFVPRPRPGALALGLCFLGATLLALGRHGLAYPALVALLPFLKSFRHPSKVAVVMALTWALLAALGVDGLCKDKGRRRWPLIVTAGAIAIALLGAVVLRGGRLSALAPNAPGAREALASAALGLVASAALAAGSIVALLQTGWPSLKPAGLVLLAALDLLLAHRSLNPTARAKLFAAPPEAIQRMETGGLVRVEAWDYLAQVLGKAYRRSPPVIPSGEGARDVPLPLAVALARHDMVSPPTAARHGVFGAFDRDWLGLQPRGVRYLGLLFQVTEETPDALRLLRMANVSYTVSLHHEGLEGLSLTTLESRFAGRVYLGAVPAPLPRAYAVGGARVADGRAAFDELRSPGFDPAREVVLAEGEPREPPPGFSADVRLVDYRPDTVALLAHLDEPGFVVLSDAWDPGWRVRVDGRVVPLLRANLGFRAVAVPAGDHRVQMVYRPRALVPGLLLTAAATLLCLLVIAATARSATQQLPQPDRVHKPEL